MNVKYLTDAERRAARLQQKRDEYARNGAARAAQRREHYVENRERICAAVRSRKQSMPEKVKAEKAKSYRNMSASARTGLFVSCAIRNALKRLIHRGKGGTKTEELLGCTIEEFMAHIASQFRPGMSWDNHGMFTWHLDHKRPCASFDLRDSTQLKQCFHFSNWQPLFAKENLQKNKFWNPEAAEVTA